MTDNINPPKNNDDPSSEDNQEDPRLNELEHAEKLEEEEWEDIEEIDHEEFDDDYKLAKDKESQHDDLDEDVHPSTEDTQDQPSILTKLSNFRPNLKKFSGSSNKKTIGIVILVLILVIGFLFWKQNSRIKTQQLQVANQVLMYATPLQDINLYLGNNLQINGKVRGKLNSSTKSGVLVIPTKGTKGVGVFNATVANGAVVQLTLVAAGKQLNVLQDQIKYEKELAAAAALKQKESQYKATFNDAVTALQNKNYDAAISGFQASITNKFELAKSYEYLAFAYSQVNQYEQCVSTYQQYILLDSQDEEGYYQMAYCQLHLMQNNAALDNLTKSCTLGYQQACDAAAQINTELSQQQAATTYENGAAGNSIAPEHTNAAPENSNVINTIPNTMTPTPPAPTNSINNPAIPSNNPAEPPNSAATNAVDDAVTDVMNNLSNTNNEGGN